EALDGQVRALRPRRARPLTAAEPAPGPLQLRAIREIDRHALAQARARLRAPGRAAPPGRIQERRPGVPDPLPDDPAERAPRDDRRRVDAARHPFFQLIIGACARPPASSTPSPSPRG